MALPIENAREIICATEATVVYDDRRATPYTVRGCVVGVPEERAGATYLRGWSFVTKVPQENIRGRWAQHVAPAPCPHCGKGV